GDNNLGPGQFMSGANGALEKCPQRAVLFGIEVEFAFGRQIEKPVVPLEDELPSEVGAYVLPRAAKKNGENRQEAEGYECISRHGYLRISFGFVLPFGVSPEVVRQGSNRSSNSRILPCMYSVFRRRRERSITLA